MMGSHKDGEREEFHTHFMCYCKIPEININYITNKLSQILLTSKALPRKRNAFFLQLVNVLRWYFISSCEYYQF